jgi:methyl-accepting chemotaxis protein
MNIQSKFTVIIGFFMLFMVSTVIASVYMSNRKMTDTAIISIAARQQMLIVRIENETRTMIALLESESSTEEQRQKVIGVATLFSQSLNALKEGGITKDSSSTDIELPSSETAAKTQLAQVQSLWEPAQQALTVILDPKVDIISDAFYDAINLLDESWPPIFAESVKAVTLLEQASYRKVVHIEMFLFVALFLTFVVAFFSLLLGKKHIVAPIKMMLKAADKLRSGDYDSTRRLPDFSKDEIGQIAAAINDMRDNLHQLSDSLRKSHLEALRINQALDNVTTSVLIADDNYNIIYMNEAAEQLFQKNEAVLSQALPISTQNSQRDRQEHRDFEINMTEAAEQLFQKAVLSQALPISTPSSQRDTEEHRDFETNRLLASPFEGEDTHRNFEANRLLGSPIEVFETHRRELLEKLTTTYRTQISSANLYIDVIINPVINDTGERLGWVTEFRDRTEEIATEQEVNAVMYAASQGYFNQRINITNKTGFFKTFSEIINQTLDSFGQMSEELMQVFAALASGDLTQTLTENYAGSLEQLKTDVNTTVNKLTKVLSVIKEIAKTVNNAANEISQGNLSLSQRTEQQAASLQQTVESMEDQTRTVQQNAEHAREAAQLATHARELAQQGGEIVGAAVAAMTEIDQSSQLVADIIGVIDEIAFQTNLLALNAAVEAARAGELGRGFAVVAAEVRRLAQRSAAEAKEIRQLVQDSLSKVKEGTRLVNQSGQTLEDIVTAVRKVNQIIIEIAAASQEQAAGIQQVNNALMQMDQVTQQNAILVEEAAIASESMKEQAKNLKNHIAFFKTDSHSSDQCSVLSDQLSKL